MAGRDPSIESLKPLYKKIRRSRARPSIYRALHSTLTFNFALSFRAESRNLFFCRPNSRFLDCVPSSPTWFQWAALVSRGIGLRFSRRV